MGNYNSTHTGTQIDNKIDNTYTKSELYTKTQIDTQLSNIYTKSQIDANIYTKTEIDANIYTKSQINTTLTTLRNTEIFDIAHPVGSHITTNSNTPPSIGTWTLKDKYLTPTTVTSFTPTLNATNCTTAACHGAYQDHYIEILFTLTNKVALTDSTLELFTINPNQFGVSNFVYDRNITHFTDGGNALIAFSMSANGVVSTTDVIVRGSSTASLAASTSISKVRIGFEVPSANCLAANCDRFVWLRTA